MKEKETMKYEFERKTSFRSDSTHSETCYYFFNPDNQYRRVNGVMRASYIRLTPEEMVALRRALDIAIEHNSRISALMQKGGIL